MPLYMLEKHREFYTGVYLGFTYEYLYSSSVQVKIKGIVLSIITAGTLFMRVCPQFNIYIHSI
jgi:hypothetical protein